MALALQFPKVLRMVLIAILRENTYVTLVILVIPVRGLYHNGKLQSDSENISMT